MKKIVLLALFPAFMLAQTQIENNPPAKPNFFEIQKTYTEKFKQQPSGKKDDEYSKFKRWEWYYNTRINPDGTFPKNSIIWDEWKKYTSSHSAQIAKSTVKSQAAWSFMGPTYTEGASVGIGRINCIAFHPTDANHFWVGTPAGGLWETTNGGSAWTINTDNLPVLGVSDIVVDYNSPSTLYIATGDADGGSLWSVNNNTAVTNGDTKSIGILKSTNGGATWTQILSSSVESELQIRKITMHPTDPNTLIAATSDGIYKTTNGGLNWSNVQAGYFMDVEFCLSDPTSVYAATMDKTGGDAQVYVSYDTGDTWAQATALTGISRINIEVCAASAGSLWAVCVNNTGESFGGMLKSDDYGQNFYWWVDASTSPNLLGYSDDGSDANGQGTYTLAFAIDPADSNTMYVGGVNTWKTTDEGATWNIKTHWSGSPNAQTVHADKHVLAFSPVNNNLFEGNDGGIYISATGGNTWTDLSNGLGISEIYRLSTAQTVSNKMLIALQDNSAKIYKSGTWKHLQDLGDGLNCMIDYSDATYTYASSYNGIIFRSNDDFVSDVNDISISTSTGGWLTPYIQDPTTPSIIYAAYSDVFASPDKGASWQPLSTNLSTTGLQFLDVASNNNYIYTGDFTHVYSTSDGGNNWGDVTNNLPVSTCSITNLTVSPSNPNEIYVTLSAYTAGEKVYGSNDGGATWINISGTLPNVPVNCITIDKNTGDAYVGTDVGVFVYNSGSNDWDLFGSGLPVVPVTDMEIQYQLNSLRVATFGRGVWETAALPAGVKNLSQEKSNVKIYPNPNNGIVTLERITDAKDHVIIYDYLGQQVKTAEVKDKLSTINIQSLPDGVYFVAMGTDHYSKLHKLVKLVGK